MKLTYSGEWNRVRSSSCALKAVWLNHVYVKIRESVVVQKEVVDHGSPVHFHGMKGTIVVAFEFVGVDEGHVVHSVY